MSFSIWMRCAGDSELRTLRLSPWRVVEAQHQVSTRKLVDSTEEQILLEEMIDSVKPPDITQGRLHYLLFTPFRYPPLPHGSRFGGRHEQGIWYGSTELRSAFAEVSYYRLLFIEGSKAIFDRFDDCTHGVHREHSHRTRNRSRFCSVRSIPLEDLIAIEL